MRAHSYLAILLLLCGTALFAQDESGSLADAARKARDSKAKSKVVINDENLVTEHGPLPEMNIEGVDNSNDVVKAIDEYRKTHSAAETEHVIHDWYDRYDAIFERAFRNNEELKARAQARSVTPQKYPDDYRKYLEQRTTEQNSELQNYHDYQKNGLLMARVQQSFQKIRNGIAPFGLKYDWMKIRFGNGNGSW